jgi:hypothetical protein
MNTGNLHEISPGYHQPLLTPSSIDSMLDAPGKLDFEDDL